MDVHNLGVQSGENLVCQMLLIFQGGVHCMKVRVWCNVLAYVTLCAVWSMFDRADALAVEDQDTVWISEKVHVTWMQALAAVSDKDNR